MLNDGCKHRQHVRPPLCPEIKRQLYLEYKQLRKQGLKVKGYRFRIRAKQIMEVTNSESSACFSNSGSTISSNAIRLVSEEADLHTHAFSYLLFISFCNIFDSTPELIAFN